MQLRITLLSAVVFLLTAAPAHAESGDAMGLGLGAQAMLTQKQGDVPAGASVTYDLGFLHFDGIVGLSTLDDMRTILGGLRGYYSLHRKNSSDLSVGLGAGVESISFDDPNIEGLTTYHVEAGAKIRAFVVSNVAISATIGFGLRAGDEDGLIVGSQFIGTFGVTYFLD